MRSQPFLHGTQLATAVHICGRLLPSGPDVDPGANRGRLSGRLRVRKRHNQEAMRRWIVLPSTIERRAQLHGRLVVLHQHLSRCALRPVRARPLPSRSAAASSDPSASIHCLSCCALGRPSLRSAAFAAPAAASPDTHRLCPVTRAHSLPQLLRPPMRLRGRLVVQRRRLHADEVRGRDTLPRKKHEGDGVRGGAIVEQPGHAMRGLRGR